MLSTFSKAVNDIVTFILSHLVWILWLTAILIFAGGVLIVVIDQVLSWLRYGNIPERDGFWLYAIYICAQQPCRPEFLEITNWVGVDKFLNWVLDLHVIVYSVLVLAASHGILLDWQGAVNRRTSRIMQQQRLELRHKNIPTDPAEKNKWANRLPPYDK